jgi:hypothetical protein
MIFWDAKVKRQIPLKINSNKWNVFFCSFKIKFDQKRLTNPILRYKKRIHFEEIDQDGFSSF